MSHSISAFSGMTVTEDDLLIYLKLSGKLLPIIAEMETHQAARHYFEQHHQQIPLSELQTACDSFRVGLGLYGANETEKWLKSLGVTVEDFEKFIETELMIKKIRTETATEDRIKEYFNQNKKDFDRFILYHLVTREEGQASMLLMEIQEEGKDFADMAKQHSIDKATAKNGGYIGIVSRKSLEKMAAGKAFEPVSGELIGPIKTTGGYQIMKIDRSMLAEQLTDEIAREIAERLFFEWVKEHK